MKYISIKFLIYLKYYFFNKKMAKSPIIFGITGKKIFITFLLPPVLIIYTILKPLIPESNDIQNI